jgi:sorting nexin-29
MEKTVCAIKLGTEISRPFITQKGLRQGDALACCLFNIALEKIVRDAKVWTRCIIYNKSTQLLSYTDGIDIVGRTTTAMSESILRMEEAANSTGLEINEEKTKCMVITNKEARRNDLGKNLIIGDHNFEVVEDLKYLGTLINTKNNVSEEIKKRIIASNRSYHGLHTILKSKYITWHSKIWLYKTLIRLVIAYASEAWVMNKCDENMLNIFERKILRKIFGAVRGGDHCTDYTDKT